MFAPTKVWRRWHRKINTTQKRHALCAAVAATGVPALVMARGHRIDEVPELPLVVSDECQSYTRTKDAVAMLERLGLKQDLEKVVKSKGIRAGKGKSRNRRYVMRKGPVVVHGKDDGIYKAFRNIPGVDVLSVDSLNLLKLAPGGHMGRMTIWTESAFKKLGPLYGSQRCASAIKKKFALAKPVMTNADVDRIINSEEIQSVLRPMKMQGEKRGPKRNALKNRELMRKLNPGSSHRKHKAQLASTKGTKEHALALKKRAKAAGKKKAHKAVSKKWFKGQMDAYKPKAAPTEEAAEE
jgi:large subunit ribosomal protein L4e